MNVSTLLARLKNEASVFVAEERRLPDGTTVYILGTHISFYPLVPRNIWYALVVAPDCDYVDQEEIEAMLRRFWHAEIDVDAWIRGKNTTGDTQ